MSKKSSNNKRRYLCRVCKCEQYPDCCVILKGSGEGESCDNCVDGASGYHKKMRKNGSGIADVAEDDPSSDEQLEDDDEEEVELRHKKDGEIIKKLEEDKQKLEKQLANIKSDERYAYIVTRTLSYGNEGSCGVFFDIIGSYSTLDDANKELELCMSKESYHAQTSGFKTIKANFYVERVPLNKFYAPPRDVKDQTKRLDKVETQLAVFPKAINHCRYVKTTET